MVAKKDTVQFLVRPTRKLVARLDELARSHKRESGNQLMVEIAEWYTDFWLEMEQAREAMFDEQWGRMQQMLKLPLKPAVTEPNKKPDAQGKKGRK